MEDASRETRIVMAIDPGRMKCGLAVVCASRPPRTLLKAIVETGRLPMEMERVMGRIPGISAVVLGNGTASRAVRQAVGEAFPALGLTLIDEHGSSERARRKYLIEHCPTGWRRLLPIGLRTPDKPYDDTVAEILAQDFLATW